MAFIGNKYGFGCSLKEVNNRNTAELKGVLVKLSNTRCGGSKMKANKKSFSFHPQRFNALQGDEVKLLSKGEVFLQKAVGGMCRWGTGKNPLVITKAR
jgi:hypothetical protein